jgi:hypothetical protein
MWYYVKGCNDEIGWLGTVTRYDDNNWIINDTLLFEQQVAATTCEITPEGLAKVAEEILQKPDGMEIYNSIRLWGHSHVNMGVSPSGQDNDQMKTFKDTGSPWFIRVIANKSGDMEFTLYDFANSLSFADVPWQILLDYSVTEDEINTEIKAKVSKLYGSGNWSKTGYYSGANSGNNYGNHAGGVWKNGAYYPNRYGEDEDYSWSGYSYYGKTEKEDDSKKDVSGGKVVQLGSTKGEKEDDDADEDTGRDWIASKPTICQLAQDIWDDLCGYDMEQVAYANSEEEVRYLLIANGYDSEILTDTIINDVWKMAEYDEFGYHLTSKK